MSFVSHIVGNLTADPELRYTQAGLPVCSFNVAVNDRKFNRQTNEWEDGETTFVRCSVWREMAEQVSQSLTKGSRVMVTGKVSMKEFETREGGKGQSLEMQVDEIGASLRYATAQINRVLKGQGTPGQAPGGYGQQMPPRGGDTPARGPAQDQWSAPAGPGQGQPQEQWATPAYNQSDDTPF
jgi:single-strand DNA-binding protein